MSRILPINNSNILNKTVDEVFELIESKGRQYESGFLENLMGYIKADDILRNFYIRFIYECECIKRIIALNIAHYNPQMLHMLAMAVSDMKNATSAETVSFYDAQFHRALFCAANEESFLEWYKLNSKALQSFLNNFWQTVGIGTHYYNELIDIHEKIYKYVADNDESNAVEYMQKHFAVLLSQFFGMSF